MRYQYFAEGNDIKFIKDFLSHMNKLHPDDIFQNTLGWTNLANVKQRFQENTDKQGRNIVFFDADLNPHERLEAINLKKNQLGLEFELFLFPNNLDPGCVETLLCSIIGPEFNNVIECFNAYCNCIENIELGHPIGIKSQFFAFAEATGQDTKLQKIDFTNNIFYDLNHPQLESLTHFVNQHIQ